jgi:hypothetical protein
MNIKIKEVPDGKVPLGHIEVERDRYEADLYQDQNGDVWAKLPIKGKDLPRMSP